MTQADNPRYERSIDHAAPLKRECAWAVYKRIDVPKKGTPKQTIPINVFYDPLTKRKLKESELPEGWWCSYDEAVEALSSSKGRYDGGYDGVAFLLTHEDPYHLTIIKDGGWILRKDIYDAYDEDVLRWVEGILEEQGTYAFHPPFGSHLYLIGKARRPEGRYKKWEEWECESYDGGWDDTQKRFTPKFVPFSKDSVVVHVRGYDIPIADVQRWVEDHVPERSWGKEVRASRDKFLRRSGESTLLKTAKIKPGPTPPKNAAPVIDNMRCAMRRQSFRLCIAGKRSSFNNCMSR